MSGRAIKLKANELPNGPNEDIMQAARQALETSNRYPNWDSAKLRELLAARYAVKTDEVVVASGSINIIRQTIIAAGHGELAFCWPSFDAFPPLGRAMGMSVQLAKVRADGSCDLDDLYARVTPQTKMVIVCTPNTPTGGIVGHQELEEFIKKMPEDVIVLIDEAYAEFVEASDQVRALDLVRSYPSVIMSRTFSKAYGLAGMRVGYGIAQKKLAERVAATGVPYALTAAAEASAIAALQDERQLQENIQTINTERKRLSTKLRELGEKVIEGHGNFIWLPLKEDALAVAERLEAYDVHVKAFPDQGVRISIGDPSETDLLCELWPQCRTT